MAVQGALDVEADESVRFTLRVSNVGGAGIELQFRNGMAADFAVVDGGIEVWRWSEGRMVTQALWSERLAPGATVTYEGAWEAPDPGTYEAVATLEATNADVEARASFEV